MEQYLIDTNVLSDYFAASLPPEGMLFMDDVINAVPNLSIITQIELLCWSTDAPTEQTVKQFIADSRILNITPEVIDHCVALRRSKKIKTPDAIIAATAIAFNLTLITGNTKDFQGVPDLVIVNPWKR